MKKWLMMLALLGLPGCAEQMMAQAEKECARFGFALGSAEHSSCMQESYGRQQAQLQDYLAAQQAAQQQQNATNAALMQSMMQRPAGPDASGYQASNIELYGIYQSSYIDGLNRICVYDKMGSRYVLTVASHQLCPI